MDEDGNWQQEEDKIETTIVSYYKSLFTSANPGTLEEVLNGVPRVVSNEMNDQLIREFTVSEVEQALFQMGPLKALGPDGMSPIFYQNFGTLWGLMLLLVFYLAYGMVFYYKRLIIQIFV